MRTGSMAMVALAAVAGWGLGWYAHDRESAEPQSDRERGATAPVAAETRSVPGELPGRLRQDPMSRVTQWLESGAYETAVAYYEALPEPAQDGVAQRVRGLMLAYAGRLVAATDHSGAIRLLERYLVAEYRDVEARLLLAEAYRGAQDFTTAIDQLYQAKGHAWRPEKLERVERRILAVVADYAALLKRQGDTVGLLELYRNLTYLEPSHAPWFIGLATAQLGSGDSAAARQSLSLVTQDPQVGAQARELLERAAAVEAETDTPPPAQAPETETAVAGIPLLRRGNHFLVEAGVGGTQSARLLIDTGASLTMLSERLLDSLEAGARPTGRTALFDTANGRVRAPIYRLETLTVGDWQIGDIEVGMLDLNDPGVDGLLGMNFLRHFRFYIDQSEAVLRLSVAQDTEDRF
ncbi:MAG: aspartyl protease family protein [Thiogranum sp.]